VKEGNGAILSEFLLSEFLLSEFVLSEFVLSEFVLFKFVLKSQVENVVTIILTTTLF
jgi:hypothetical protein